MTGSDRKGAPPGTGAEATDAPAGDVAARAAPPACGASADDVPVLDLCGLNCPLPALKTRRRLAGMAPGERVRVLATDPLAGIDVPHAVREAGGTVLAGTAEEATGVRSFLVEAGARVEGEADDREEGEAGGRREG